MSEIKQDYKQTKVGIIPENWEVVRLGDIFEIKVGKDLDEKNYSPIKTDEHIYPIYSNTVENRGLYGYSKTKEYQGNSLTVVGRGIGLGTAFSRHHKFCAIGRLLVLQPKKKSNVDFISEYINFKMKIFDESSGIPQLTGVSFSTYLALNPPLKEQEKIAQILTTWDEAITKQTELLRAKELLKIALMQKLLSGEVRFSGFSDEWEEVKLGEIVKKMQSGGTPKADNQEFYNGNIPFVKVNDIRSSGKYLIKTESSITEKGLKNSSAWIVPINSIIYSMYASVGFLSINKIEVTTSQAMINIILDVEKANLEYIYYHLLDFKKNVHTYVETGTQGNLNAQTVRNLKIKLPSLAEQQKIAEVLSLADDEINLLKNELEELKLQKKALMQKLLTGQVRVKV